MDSSMNYDEYIEEYACNELKSKTLDVLGDTILFLEFMKEGSSLNAREHEALERAKILLVGADDANKHLISLGR